LVRSNLSGREKRQRRNASYYLEFCEGAAPAGEVLGAAFVSVFELSDPGGVIVADAGEVFVSLLLEVSGTGVAGVLPAPGAGVGEAGALEAVDVSVAAAGVVLAAGAAGVAGADGAVLELSLL
jgi:hypothetical protein